MSCPQCGRGMSQQEHRVGCWVTTIYTCSCGYQAQQSQESHGTPSRQYQGNGYWAYFCASCGAYLYAC